MKVLHLSDTQLSGSPIRIVDLLNRCSDVEARHIVWHKTFGYRSFKTDLAAREMTEDQIRQEFEEADVLHFHNRWRRQEIFGAYPDLLRFLKKPSVIQIHSPRLSEDFSDEAASGLPLAVIAQYHVRQWPELRFIVPNVVDLGAAPYLGHVPVRRKEVPRFSYAPSNTNAKGWDDKSYEAVAPVLKRLRMRRRADYQLIIKKPHDEALALKATADIGVDEVATGSYHLSSLEYMAFGIPVIAHIDAGTERVVRDLTGADRLPWIRATKGTFEFVVEELLRRKDWAQRGDETLSWMGKYWHPAFLARCYTKMYEELR